MHLRCAIAKLHALDKAFGVQPPDAILSANMGCIAHLQSNTSVPVRHWIEVLDEMIALLAKW